MDSSAGGVILEAEDYTFIDADVHPLAFYNQEYLEVGSCPSTENSIGISSRTCINVHS